MNKTSIKIAAAALMLGFAGNAGAQEYVPTPENLQARQEFADYGFGIFLHWGLYSMFGQGEWYLNYGPDAQEYAKSARGFYPAYFDADQWVSAIKDAGAKYITITTRHHDGFSMWNTEHSDYNIVDATPFGRDVIKELADACHRQGIKLHLYYSHLDWTRDDYPWGRTGHTTGRDSTKADWPHYYKFMNDQLTELLTNYGEIGAIWFDGWWDHDEDAVPFNWELPEQYALIHKLQPACLVGNNHHQAVNPGEDIQIFERDVPGENTAGLSGQSIGHLPLETCQTMNGMWGYKIMDQDYKSTEELIRLLVKTASLGANLLLNIGPQPSGELPATALDRLKEIGEWLRANGEAFYATEAPDFKEQTWGVGTLKGNKLYLHVFDNEAAEIDVPTAAKVKGAKAFATGEKLKFKKTDTGVRVELPQREPSIDYIVELELK